MPILYGKKLLIILVGYQEIEAKNNFHLFDGDERTKEFLGLCESWNIKYIKFSEIYQKMLDIKNFKLITQLFKIKKIHLPEKAKLLIIKYLSVLIY